MIHHTNLADILECRSERLTHSLLSKQLEEVRPLTRQNLLIKCYHCSIWPTLLQNTSGPPTDPIVWYQCHVLRPAEWIVNSFLASFPGSLPLRFLDRIRDLWTVWGSSPKCHVCRQENGVPDGHFIAAGLQWFPLVSRVLATRIQLLLKTRVRLGIENIKWKAIP